MCGRFSLVAIGQVLMDRFNIESDLNLKPNYNAGPMQHLPIITNNAPNKLTMAQWNLVPSWSKKSKTNFLMINARVETLLEKSSYKKPFQSQRCLIPVDSFYEWQKMPSGKKPFRIMLNDEQLFTFAGLYDIWKNENDEILQSFTIITLPANDLIKPIHDRMPIILKKEYEKLWLDNTPVEKLLEIILKPYPSNEMKAYEVSTLVNSVKNNSIDVIKPAEKKKTLFDY